MMLTIAGCRLAMGVFPESLVPDGRVEFYLRFAAKSLNEERWGELYEEGAYFFAAHYLTLDLEAAKSGDGSGGISAAAGPVVSESESKRVGGVSKTVIKNRAGAAAAAYAEAGDYNDTVYGKRYWRLAQLIGAGGTVV